MLGLQTTVSYLLLWDMCHSSPSFFNSSLDDREKKIEQAFALIEKDLDLYGCTCVEDQMQSNVPETVDALVAAHIMVVMLTGLPLLCLFLFLFLLLPLPSSFHSFLSRLSRSFFSFCYAAGDKVETAVSIGKQSSVLKPYMQLLMISGTSAQQCATALSEALETVKSSSTSTPPPAAAAIVAQGAKRKNGELVTADAQQHKQHYAVIIDGISLELCLQHHMDSFVELLTHCETVCCSHISSLPSCACFSRRIAVEILL